MARGDHEVKCLARFSHESEDGLVSQGIRLVIVDHNKGRSVWEFREVTESFRCHRVQPDLVGSVLLRSEPQPDRPRLAAPGWCSDEVDPLARVIDEQLDESCGLVHPCERNYPRSRSAARPSRFVGPRVSGDRPLPAARRACDFESTSDEHRFHVIGGHPEGLAAV